VSPTVCTTVGAADRLLTSTDEVVAGQTSAPGSTCGSEDAAMARQHASAAHQYVQQQQQRVSVNHLSFITTFGIQSTLHTVNSPHEQIAEE